MQLGLGDFEDVKTMNCCMTVGHHQQVCIQSDFYFWVQQEDGTRLHRVELQSLSKQAQENDELTGLDVCSLLVSKLCFIVQY